MEIERRPRRRGGAPEPRDAGFTLIEVSVAAILVVAFALAAAASFGTAFGVSRGNLLRQQATAVVSQELEYVRTLAWSELAMASVDTGAPMLGSAGTTLLGSEAGFTGEETLVVFTDTGLVTPYRTYDIDGDQYAVWRYVTHEPSGPRRFVVLVTWSNEAASDSLLSSTLITESTARGNTGAVVTLPDGSPAPTTTTSSTTTTTTTTTTPPTTTTTLPGLVIESLSLTLSQSQDKQTATVLVDYASGGNAVGAVVVGQWSTTPPEAGYPFTVNQVTSGPGRATFVHNDGHIVLTVVQFCVTDIVLSGYSYSGGTQCVSAVW
jgi:prepilin-type N-terminal cleavage/methylation domain-containing protein